MYLASLLILLSGDFLLAVEQSLLLFLRGQQQNQRADVPGVGEVLLPLLVHAGGLHPDGLVGDLGTTNLPLLVGEHLHNDPHLVQRPHGRLLLDQHAIVNAEISPLRVPFAPGDQLGEGHLVPLPPELVHHGLDVLEAPQGALGRDPRTGRDSSSGATEEQPVGTKVVVFSILRGVDGQGSLVDHFRSLEENSLEFVVVERLLTQSVL